jgi:hypothetical protein
MSHAAIDVLLAATTCVDNDSGDGNAIGGNDDSPLEGEKHKLTDADKQGLCRRIWRVLDGIVRAGFAGAKQGALGGDGMGTVVDTVVVVVTDVVGPLESVGITVIGFGREGGPG